MSNIKFNSSRFKALIQKKLQQKGLSNRTFVSRNGFSRSPFMKAMAGMTRPSLDNLNKWCKALDCSPEERAEIISAVYVDDEPSTSTAAA